MGKVINRNNIVEGAAVLSAAAVCVGAVHSLGEAVFSLSIDRDSSIRRQLVEHIGATLLITPGTVLLATTTCNAIRKLKK